MSYQDRLMCWQDLDASVLYSAVLVHCSAKYLYNVHYSTLDLQYVILVQNSVQYLYKKYCTVRPVQILL